MPHRARWLTADPLWPDEKAYEYVGNIPVSLFDLTGLAGSSPNEWRYFNGGGFGPPSSRLCAWARKRLAQALRSRDKWIHRGWPNSTFDLGGKSWGGGLTVPGGHTVEYLQNEDLIRRLQAFLNAFCNPPKPPRATLEVTAPNGEQWIGLEGEDIVFDECFRKYRITPSGEVIPYPGVGFGGGVYGWPAPGGLPLFGGSPAGVPAPLGAPIFGL